MEKCGIFVDPELSFLGASPDGITDNGAGLIEVKCPYVGRDSAIQPGKNFPFLCKDESGEKFELRRTHNYFYQVQGQLGIAKRSYCYFIVYTLKDFFVQKIEFDRDFFSVEMLPKLRLFYTEQYRPYVASNL